MGENYQEKLNEILEELEELSRSIKYGEKTLELEKLTKEALLPNFWDDKEKANQTIEAINDLKSSVKDFEFVKVKTEEALDLLTLDSQEALEIIKEEYHIIEKTLNSLRREVLFEGEHDPKNCFLEIHSGAGGTEAADWAGILFRMYCRYCESKGYPYEIINYLEGEEAGIKSVTIYIKGKYAFGNLKNEKGIHRLIRLSPFDSNKRRHTSFASVDVIPKIDMTIDFEIKDQDLRIDVFRSSGKGGQGVNTTDSAVRITHLPTGIVATCQNERSQIQNKAEALKILKNKLYILEEEKKKEELKELKGEMKKVEFGSQVRTYTLHPYSLVKDHRSNYETTNVNKVLDGYLDEFIESLLKNK